jgi:hypothetical protein
MIKCNICISINSKRPKNQLGRHKCNLTCLDVAPSALSFGKCDRCTACASVWNGGDPEDPMRCLSCGDDTDVWFVK